MQGVEFLVGMAIGLVFGFVLTLVSEQKRFRRNSVIVSKVALQSESDAEEIRRKFAQDLSSIIPTPPYEHTIRTGKTYWIKDNGVKFKTTKSHRELPRWND